MHGARDLLLLHKRQAAAAWTPLSLGGTLKGWWDFSDPASLYTDAGVTPVNADGQAIYRAADKSGNAEHMQITTAVMRPTYKVALVNGLSIGLFDGGDQLNAVWLPSDATDNFAMVGVAQATSVAATAALMSWGDGTGNGFMALVPSNGGKFGWYIAGTGYGNSTVNADTNLHIVVARRTSGVLRLYVDGGTAVLTSAAAIPTPNTALLGACGAGLNYPGRLCDVYYLAGETADNVNDLGAYLAGKWGATWADIPP